MSKEQKDVSTEMKQLKELNEKLKENYGNLRKENEKMKKELNEVKTNVEWPSKGKKENNIILTALSTESANPEHLKEKIEKFCAIN